jgi:hypothetical protein
LRKFPPALHEEVDAYMHLQYFFFIFKHRTLKWHGIDAGMMGSILESLDVENVVTPPTPWAEALLTNFAGFINGRICVPPQIQGIYYIFLPFASKVKLYKGSHFGTSFLNVFYSNL